MAQSVWARPIRIYTPPLAPPPPPPTVVSITPQPPRPTFISPYDEARIFKDIKLVADLRQSGEERGEVQSGDNGILGPDGIAPPRTAKPTAAPVAKTNLAPILLAIAAFVILGG